MAGENAQTLTTHWYPDYIINPIHKNRCMKIIVKESATVQSMWDTIAADVEKKSSEIKSIYDRSANLWADGKKVSDIDTTGSVENTKKIKQGDPIYACCLPLPNELSEVLSPNWTPEDSLLGSFVGSTMSNIHGKMTSGLAGKIEANKTVGKIAGNIDTSKIVGNVSHYLGLRKPMIDPGQFQNFNGVPPRGFSFSFDFIPNNAAEAKSILNIILNLKKFSLPRSIVGGVALLAPFSFEIEIGNERLKKLINMNDVVITGITVNYGADGGMQMFSDGTPKHITMQLDVSERSLITSEFYD